MSESSCPVDREWQITPAELKDFKECQLIHTLTTSRTPLLKLDDIGKDVHISAVGADSPGKCELDMDIVEKAEYQFFIVVLHDLSI